MSVIRKKPFIESVIEDLTDEQKASLLSVMNGSGNTIDASFTNLPEADVAPVLFQLEPNNLKTGILIQAETYDVLLAYHRFQDMQIYKLDLSKFTYEKINEYLDINELRRTISGSSGGGSEVVANPTLEGTEPNLEGLEVDGEKYKIPEGTVVEANPTLAGTESPLTGLQVGDTKYAVASGGKAHAYVLQIVGAYPDDYNAKCLYFTDNDNLKGATNVATQTNLTNDLLANGHTSQRKYCYVVPINTVNTSDYSLNSVIALWVSSTTLKSYSAHNVPSIDTSGDNPIFKVSITTNANITVDFVNECTKIY